VQLATVRTEEKPTAPKKPPESPPEKERKAVTSSDADDFSK
jgi:hypothetical protein